MGASIQGTACSATSGNYHRLIGCWVRDAHLDTRCESLQQEFMRRFLDCTAFGSPLQLQIFQSLRFLESGCYLPCQPAQLSNPEPIGALVTKLHCCQVFIVTYCARHRWHQHHRSLGAWNTCLSNADMFHLLKTFHAAPPAIDFLRTTMPSTENLTVWYRLPLLSINVRFKEGIAPGGHSQDATHKQPWT